MRDRRAKFLELANQRVNKALDQLRLVGNLSNRGAYDYTDEDVRKIVKALQKGVDGMKAKFSDSGGSAENTFKL